MTPACSNTPGSRPEPLLEVPTWWIVGRGCRVRGGEQSGLDAALDGRLWFECDQESLAAALQVSARLSQQSERRLLELMLRFLRYCGTGLWGRVAGRGQARACAGLRAAAYGE